MTGFRVTRRPRPETSTVRLRLELHGDVVAQALNEIRANPHIEVGGKFVGFVEGGFAADSAQWREDLAELRVTVVAYLDAGPGKDRTAVHHLSDTDYQFRLFQEVAGDFPDLHFLGIWHSHHPNGLDTLSQGDEQTGTVTVNNPGHDHDFLLSSLAVDLDGLMGGRHFVFLRGRAGFLEIDRSDVVVVQGANPVAERIAQATRRLDRAGGEPGPASGDAATWTRTSAGKAILLEDRVWLARYPDLRPFLRQGSMVWRGRVELSGTTAECEYIYPEGFPSAPPIVDVRTSDGAHAVRYTLPSAGQRESGFHFALSRLTDLITSGRVTWDDDENGPEE
ncbi:hypothetical protein [Herbidospora mongoliensis]|uniref:hypothetical protein n=1 Tax=Herbidospora mongoliensis TaxID=688067 RepID=UPI00082ABF24|nr:hypothetical protein [Herbidospora mongoliensis]